MAIKEDMKERRITAYVSKKNKDNVTIFRKKFDVPLSRAVDMILTDFFRVKR